MHSFTADRAKRRLHPRRALLLVACAFMLLGLTLDTRFGEQGLVLTDLGLEEEATAMAVLPDGSILQSGWVDHGAGRSFALAKYDHAGALAKAFGTQGAVSLKIGLDAQAMTMAVQPDGRILLAGTAFSGIRHEFAVARFLPDGTLDRSFGHHGVVTIAPSIGDSAVHAMALLPRGGIILAGEAFVDNSKDFALAMLDRTGAPVPAFGRDGVMTLGFDCKNDVATAVALQRDGRILVSGWAEVGLTSTFAVARLFQDGTLDRSFAGNGTVTLDLTPGDDGVADMVVDHAGRVLLAGTGQPGLTKDFALVRLNPDGTVDRTFGRRGLLFIDISGRDDHAAALAVRRDGRIFVAGTAHTGLNTDFAVVRILDDGRIDRTLFREGVAAIDIAGMDDRASAIALLPDDRVLLGGTAMVGSDTVFALAMLTHEERLTIPGSQTFVHENGGGCVISSTAAGGAEWLLLWVLLCILHRRSRKLGSPSSTTGPSVMSAKYAKPYSAEDRAPKSVVFDLLTPPTAAEPDVHPALVSRATATLNIDSLHGRDTSN
jgi:uncharacterized delta-60 repeat protein